MEQLVNEHELLREYRQTRSNEAFRRLVDRYVDLVYGTARRQVPDSHLAEDITQAVFILLAQKADTVPTDRSLAGWLHRATTYAAANARRAHATRQHHERRALAMTQRSAPDDGSSRWELLSPLLDEGLSRLRQKDRDAILLKFFERRTLRQVGEAMGISEEAAAKRVARAVERLRDFFDHRGVTVSAAALSATLAGHSAEAAPAGLAVSITTVATTPAAAGAGAVLAKGAMILMAAEKTKTAVITAAVLLLLLGGGAVVVNKLMHPTVARPPRPMRAEPRPVPVAQPETVLRFANGAVVHILGINDRPYEATTWWAPDGSEIPTPETESGRVDLGRLPGMRAIQVSATVDEPSDTTVTFSMNPPPTRSSGLASSATRWRRTYSYVAAVAAERTMADLIVGAARGPWELDVSYDLAPGEEPPGAPPGQKVIEEVREENGQTVVRMRQPLASPGPLMHSQFFLMSDDGEVFASDVRGLLASTEHTFPVPLAKVIRARYRARPYEVIELRNVALRPGMQTESAVVRNGRLAGE